MAGDIYFFSEITPFFIDSVGVFPDRKGGIVKVNSALDTVLWSMPFSDEVFDPVNPIAVINRYEASGILKLRDGNFLAYGRLLGLANAIEEWGGFVSKFTSEGEILWIRAYHPELDKQYVDLNNGREYKPSTLVDCHELPDGRILCTGMNNFATPEISFHSEIWLLMLDSDGCLEPNCGDDMVSSQSALPLQSQQGYVYPNPTTNKLRISDVVYDNYEIHDLVGRLQQKGDFTTEIQLNDQISSGMYILHLKENGNLKSVFKFLKTNE